MLTKVRNRAGVLLLVLLIGLPSALYGGEVPRVVIGIALDGPWEKSRETVEVFKGEIRTLTRGEFRVEFPEDRIVEADWSMKGAGAAVDSLLSDPGVDMVIPLGVLVSSAAARRGPLPKPVVAPLIVGREVLGIPWEGDASGVKNFSYVALPSSPRRDLQVFHDLVPFQRLTVLISRGIHDALPELRESVLRLGEDIGFHVDFVQVETSAKAVLEALPKDVDAVYVTPFLQLDSEAFEKLVAGLISRKLPSFSLLGREEVEQGVMAGAAPVTDFPRLARRTALNIQRILAGEDASRLPVVFAQEKRLAINMATARAVGFYPRWAVLTEAELLYEEPTKVGPEYSLSQAVEKALQANLDLAANRRVVAAGKYEVKQARSALLPRLALGADASLIDDDRAALSSGSQPERALSGGARFEQSIYSDRKWSDYTRAGHFQLSREQQLEQLRLDIVQQSAEAYLNVLRAKTVQRIQRQNLSLSRSNLELAQIRQRIGLSGPAEVYRWQSQIANDRQQVIAADVQRHQAELALNRLLNQAPETPLETIELGLDDPSLITSRERFLSYIDNPWSFKVFRDFMAEEAIGRAPEIMKIDAAIAAEKRSLVAAQRAFYVPDLNLQGALTERLARGGEGASGPAVGAYETQWNLNLNLSLPLYTGGGRRAEVARNRQELSRLRLERQALAETIDQRIRSAMHRARGSFTAIRLSREAAEAARKNLDLVTESYSRGAVSIIELLDAQNASLVADQSAANAVFDFLVDLMEVERAAGWFDFLAQEEELQDWFQRLATYFADAGIELPKAKQ